MSRSLSSLSCAMIIAVLHLLPFRTSAQNSAGSKSPEEQIRFQDNVSKFSDIDFFSGNPNIQIDLWKIEMNDFSMPVSLQYDINGVKVDEIPSMTGLGWGLIAGGSIVRTIRDFPDDKYVKRNIMMGEGGFTGKKKGFMKGGADRLSNFNMNHASTWRNSYELAMTMGTAFHFDDNKNGIKVCEDNDGIQAVFYDTEPDQFHLYAPTVATSFMFNKNNQVKFTEQSNVAVTYVMDDGVLNPEDFNYKHSTKGITSFTVTDEHGNKFIFADQVISYFYSGMDRWNIYFPGTEGTLPSGNHASRLQYIATTEWKLSRIVTKSGDEVFFNYETYDVTYASASRKGKIDPILNTLSLSRIVRKEKRLTSIETTKERIRFIPGETRVDLTNTKTLGAIEVHKINNGSSSLIKTINFQYSYFQSNSSEATVYPVTGMIQDDVYKRLKLNSITERGTGVDEKMHSFDYNEQLFQLPNRLSPKKDFWGFFNNSANSGVYDLFPTIMVYPNLRAPDKITVFDFDADNSGTPYNFIKGYRFPSADGNVAGACGLKKITYPTGGSHEFVFEPHTYFYKNKNFYGGGLRIKQEKIYDPVSNRELIKTYDYQDANNPLRSSGKIINFPLFAFTENSAGYGTHIDGTGYMADPYVLVPTQNNDYYKYFISRTTEPEWALGTWEKNTVEYRNIKEYTEYNGVKNGYTEYTFNAVDFKEMMDNNYIYFPQSIPWRTTYTLWVGNIYDPNPCTPTPMPAGHTFDQEFDSYADIRGLDFDKCAIPTSPYSGYSWNRGQLLNKKSFNAASQLLKEEICLYEDLKEFEMSDLVEGLSIRTFENYKIGKSQNLSTTNYGRENPWVTDFTVYTPYKYYTSNKSVLTSLETRTYQTGAGYLSDLVTYKYNNKAQLSSETRVNSNGICKRITYLYPTDLEINENTADPNAKAIYELQKKNQLDLPVEKVTHSSCSGNVSAVAAELSIYETHYGAENTIVPKEVWKMESSAPSGFTPLQYNGSTLNRDVKYKKDKDFVFNSLHRLTQEQKYSDLKKAYLWGYSNNYMIASVVGAGVNEVAYTSFEENDMKGWAVTTPMLVPGYGLTGNNNYSLGNGNVYSTIPLNPSVTYILSFWQYNGIVPTVNGEISSREFPDRLVNQWMYVEKEITGVTKVVIQSVDAGSGQIDELRLYPKGAQMTTYAYDPLVGMTSQCDPRNILHYYEYDDFQRLARVRDMDKNIIKQFEHKFKVQYAAGTVYVKSRRENFNRVGNNTFGDLMLRFYSDAACTIPVTVNNLTVTIQEMYWDEYSNEVWYTTNFNSVCSGSVYKVKSQTLMSVWLDPTETSREYYYIIQPGTGYVSAGSAQL